MNMFLEETLELTFLCHRADYNAILDFINSKTNSELDIILNNKLDIYGKGTVLHVLLDWNSGEKFSKVEEVCQVFELLVNNGAKYYTNNTGYYPWERSPYVPSDISKEVEKAIYYLRNRFNLFKYEIPRDDV